MVSTESLRLMNAVLDGEATAAERAELEQLLAADAAARAQYGRRGCPAVRRAGPRAASRAAVRLRRSGGRRAALHQREGTDQVRQPFAKSGVIGPSGSDIIVGDPAKRVTIARTTLRAHLGESAHEYEQAWFVDRWWCGCCRGSVVLQWARRYRFPTSGDNATGTMPRPSASAPRSRAR